MSREFAILKETQLKFLPNAMNYFNNDKTNQNFDINQTNSVNKILEKK